MASANTKPNSYSKNARNDESRNSLTSGVQSRTFGGTFGANKDLSPKPERNSMGHPNAFAAQQQANKAQRTVVKSTRKLHLRCLVETLGCWWHVVDTARHGRGLNGSGVGMNKTELQRNRTEQC